MSGVGDAWWSAQWNTGYDVKDGDLMEMWEERLREEVGGGEGGFWLEANRVKA